MIKPDAEQEDAIKAIEGPVCIIAGPGSGKTFVLTERIFHLIKDRGADPKDILAITFTNKAADEMRSRIEKRLGSAPAMPKICTFHAFAYDVLREHYGLAGLAKDFEVSEDGQDGAIAISFDELLELARKLFHAHKEILRDYQRAFKYILIDEYQDTNPIQAEIMDMLAAAHKNICIVGDFNQAIYAFRGATPEYFRTFAKRYPEARIIELRRNYRSTRNIVNIADSLMGVKSFAQSPVTGENINLVKARTDMQEAIYLANEAGRLIGGTDMLDSVSCKYSPGDIAIIYRLNVIGRYLEEVFSRAGIPYIRSGEKFDDVRIERHAVSLLTAHAAKGLEFPVVFIVGAEDGIFPYRGPSARGRTARGHASQPDPDEERRLFYVAVTRAKERLCITNSKRRMLFGQALSQKDSRFLSDMPKGLMNISHIENRRTKKSSQRVMF